MVSSTGPLATDAAERTAADASPHPAFPDTAIAGSIFHAATPAISGPVEIQPIGRTNGS